MQDDCSTAESEPCQSEACESKPCDAMAAFVRGALLLQEKWVLMIVFSLMQGSTGFSELMRRGNVNTTTLTQRLNLLEQRGLLVKTIHSTMPPRTSYTLTETGRALTPVFAAITAWSERYLLSHAPTEECPGTKAICDSAPPCCPEDSRETS